MYPWPRIVFSSVTWPIAGTRAKRDGHGEGEAVSMHGMSAQHGGIAQGGNQRASIQRSGDRLGVVLVRGT